MATARNLELRADIERRRSKRKQIYIGEKIVVTFTYDGNPIAGEVISISPFGMGIILDKHIQFEINNDPLVFLIKPSGRSESTVKGIIRSVSQFKRGEIYNCRISLEFKYAYGSYSSIGNIRGHKTSSDLRPTLFFEHPWFIGTLIYLQVVEIGLNGCRCTTSARNHSIFGGLRFRAQVCFPVVGTVQLECEITNIYPQGDKLELSISFISKIDILSSYASDYLILIGADVTIPQLREEGFLISGFAKNIDISYIKSKYDFEDVLALRLKGQHSINKFLDVTDIKKMSDDFDQFSRHIVATHKGKIVSATRLIFNGGDKRRCEHLSYGFVVPDWLWKEGFVETSRLVVDPDYRGYDLFSALIAFLGQTVFQSGYRYMLASCNDSLLKIYLKAGCKKIGEFSTGPDEVWNVIVLDIINCLKSNGVDPIVWNLIHAETSEYLQGRDILKVNFFQKSKLLLRMSFGRWLIE